MTATLKELLEAVEDRYASDGACAECTHYSCERRRRRTAEAIAARSAIETLFASLEVERDKWKSVHPNDGLVRELARLHAQLSRLRSTQITAEEARRGATGLEIYASTGLCAEAVEEYTRIAAKLRAISEGE